jgi:asparagine synthase (glutamine-hydrolysing)
MCGFTGFLDLSASPKFGEDIIQRMLNALSHRGPDDQGSWADSSCGVVLGHRRLSILDLSPAGHQPMHSSSGRFVIAFNGEIYNHLAIREELPHRDWRGHSDTETLLEAIETWGIAVTLSKLVGMFGFALWDRKDKSLCLARDRAGEKPLYYGWTGDTLIFGSELKALRQHPKFDPQVDRDALCLFMRYSYIPAPHTIYQGVRKLDPGTFFIYETNGNRSPSPRAYWSFSDVARRGVEAPFSGSDDNAVTALDGHLRQAVQGQMLSDVPLGAFLSGGIDSSLIVATMQTLSSSPVRTFSIGFHESEYNEAPYAKAVAQHLGTDHTELYVTPKETLDVIPSLPHIYDEPFADSSQIPTFLVSKLAKSQVSVCLSGDGGDELFGGYNRYIWSARSWDKVRRVPPSLRGALSNCMTQVSPEAWNALFSTLRPALPKSLRYANPGDKIHKLSEVLGARTQKDVFMSPLSHWNRPEQVVLGGTEGRSRFDEQTFDTWMKDSSGVMMLLDSLTYLPDDILVKVDRAAMAVSLETRVPFLDHRLIEFAWTLPLHMKIRGRSSKWILRRLLERHIPSALIERPKMGFGVPIDHWLRGPIREWAEALLAPDRLQSEGYLNPEMIHLKWREHLSGQRNWAGCLWNVLMFQAWLEESQKK